MSTSRCFVVLCLFFASAFFCFSLEAPISLATALTDEELTFVSTTKHQPITVGIIPQLHPLSVCPPEAPKFDGITVHFLDLIAKKTGLNFKYVRIPIENFAPVPFLRTGSVDLVAGNLKTQKFIEDKTLILSYRLYDATISFITKKGVDILDSTEQPVRIATMQGFQVGREYILSNFKYSQIECYATASECLDAVRDGKVDFAVINRYVASYYL